MNGHPSPTTLEEVTKDFRKTPKEIQVKYLYDQTGDSLFQQLMKLPDYYLTNCEAEIFSTQTKEVAESLQNGSSKIDLIDLGAGDATKTVYLLQHLVNQDMDFTYYPVDISSAMISDLETNLPKKIPRLKMKGCNGEYFEMLQEITKTSTSRSAVLVMGGNIGNFTVEECSEFLKEIGRCLKPKDTVLVGFDLVKHPRQISAAYNTPVSIKFNLNYLDRFNKELGANFELDQYEHYSIYDPAVRAQRNFILSLKDQVVRIGDEEFQLGKYELIRTAISQKYTVEETQALAAAAGFKPAKYFYDSNKWYLDVVWEKI